MSAFLCDPIHVGRLAAQLCRDRETRRYVDRELREHASKPDSPVQRHAGLVEGVAIVLAAENVASVAYRYPDDGEGNRPGPSGIATDAEYLALCAAEALRAEREFQSTPLGLTGPATIFAACDCYEYQACEHPGWRDSLAAKFLHMLRKDLWQAIPGHVELGGEWIGEPRRERLTVQTYDLDAYAWVDALPAEEVTAPTTQPPLTGDRTMDAKAARAKEVKRVRAIIAAGRAQFDDDGREIVKTATCGQCGRSWNDARISELTPTPAARCPFEYAHKY